MRPIISIPFSLSAAFGTINHDILLECLSDLEVSGWYGAALDARLLVCQIPEGGTEGLLLKLLTPEI